MKMIFKVTKDGIKTFLRGVDYEQNGCCFAFNSGKIISTSNFDININGEIYTTNEDFAKQYLINLQRGAKK